MQKVEENTGDHTLGSGTICVGGEVVIKEVLVGIVSSSNYRLNSMGTMIGIH